MTSTSMHCLHGTRRMACRCRPNNSLRRTYNASSILARVARYVEQPCGRDYLTSMPGCALRINTNHTNLTVTDGPYFALCLLKTPIGSEIVEVIRSSA